MYTVLLWPKSGTVLFQRSPRAQDAISLTGWNGSRSVAIVAHTYISDHMHQVVTGLGRKTIDITLRSTGINEEYSKVSALLKYKYQSVEHYPKLMENSTTYATHSKIVVANQSIIVQYPRVTDIGWSTLPITTKCKHMTYCTYYIETSTIPRTVHSIPGQFMIRLRVPQYNVHPPLSHSSR